MTLNVCIASCPRCGNRTPHTVYGSFVEESYDEYSDHYEKQETVFLRCGTCFELCVTQLDEEGDEVRCLWPEPPSLSTLVPKRVREYYSGALKIKDRVPSAFAVQIRRALEAMCTERGATGRDLNAQLKALVKMHSLPEIAAEMAKHSRLLGNKGAHDGPDVTRQEAGVLEDFFLALIEYIYVAPAKLLRYQTALTKLKPPKPESTTTIRLS